jgi:hypothetical protein
LGSGTDDGGGGGGDDSVARLPEKEDVNVPPGPTVDSNVWKLSFKGIVKTPETAMLVDVKLSTSRPEMLNVAVAVVADVSWKSNGDCIGVQTWPPAGGVAMQPAAPSIPGSRRVRVIVMFGALVNVINATMFRDPGGFVMSSIVPVVPARDVKLPCWELAGEFIEKTLVPKPMPAFDSFTVPVIFRTPVIKDALAVRGIIMNAIKLIVAILFVRGSSFAEGQIPQLQEEYASRR